MPPVNDLQDAARALCPAIDDALFPGAMVSGSGPTVFAIYESPHAARAAAATLPGAIAVEPVPPGYGEVRPA